MNPRPPADEPLEDLAALYLSGALEPDQRADFERRLESGDPDYLAAVRDLAPALDALVEAIEPDPSPPAPVRETLLKLVRWTTRGRGRTSVRSEEVEVITDAEMGWRPTTSRGVTIRPLWSDPGSETFLLRMEPGAILKPHPHGTHGEECYLVEGDAFSAGFAMKTGDFQRLPYGTHGPVSTRNGCLILVHLSTENPEDPGQGRNPFQNQ